MAINLTSIDIMPGEFDLAKQRLKEVLDELWKNKTESHYILLNLSGHKYGLKINTKDPQVLYSAERTVLLPFLKATLNEFFAGKIPAGQEYFYDIDHDQRMKNTQTGVFISPAGTPIERLQNEPRKEFAVKHHAVEAAVPVEKPSLIGFFKRKVQPKPETPDVKPDGTKLEK